MSEKYNETSASSLNMNWDCIIKDVLKKWWLILITVAAITLLTGGIVQLLYSPVYEAKTTFAIGTAGFSYNNITSNLAKADTTTKRFSDIVDTNVLYKRVCDDLEISSYSAKVTVNTIESSNLMEMSVIASTPRMAYLLSGSIIEMTEQLMNENQYSDMTGVVMHEIQATVVPEKPYNSSNALLYMGYAALISLIAIILILGMLSYYKDTIRSIGDVNLKVDAKLMGTIYFEKKRGRKASMLISNPMLSFAYVESYRMLATRVKLALDKEDKKVLFVTSVSENEGKSTVAANIALALAQEGKRVILADCDFRKPAQYKIFEVDVPEERDFCMAISSRTAAKVGHVKQSAKLYTLFSKQFKNMTWDSASTAYMERMFDFLKNRVDYVIIDTAPMAFVSDTEEYASYADASLIVVRQDVMEACYINDAIDNLENAGTPVIGCVFNGVRRGIIEKTADYGSYQGSHYAGRYSNYNKSRRQAGE